MLKMTTNLKVIMFTILPIMFIFLFVSCIADTNQNLGSTCSGADNSTLLSEYQTNLNNLLNALAANAPTKNGFYTTSEGKNLNKIYGLTQCRADISAKDCGNCIKNATSIRGCRNSRSVTIWLTWCFIRYSDENFIGVWDHSAYATANDTDFEDTYLVTRGLNFWNELASTTPGQPLMFQTSVLDVGQSGKRYGMAQCARDISKSDCGECLDYQLETFRTLIGNKRNWDIYGTSCSIWYHDYQFYFNYSIPATIAGANEGNATFSSHPSSNCHRRYAFGYSVSVGLLAVQAILSSNMQIGKSRFLVFI